VTRRAPLVAALAVASLWTLAGCTDAASVDDGTEGPAVSDMVDDAEDAFADTPEECREAFPLAMGGADIADLALLPSDWPAPPDGAVLCGTAETIGGARETASYAIDAPIGDVLTHYETALTGYETFRESGDENGTGYDSLSGGDDVFGFQIRESDGGFVLAFGRDDSGS
jgi:uncharacterized protein YceK